MKSNSLQRIGYLFILIALPLLSFGNDQAKLLFAKGNADYAKAHYKEALVSYQKALAGGYRSASVYYNMGNANYKLGEIPSALLYYEKAHQLLPNDEDINTNIRIANLKTSDKIEEVPEFFLNKWWDSCILSFSVHAFSVLSIVFVLFGSGFLILYFFAYLPAIKRSGFYAAIIFFLVGLFTLFIAGRQVSYFEEHRQGIIFSSPVAVKSAPTEQSKSLFILHEGTKVNIVEGNSGWTKIKLANGNEGWIKLAELREI